MFRLDSEIEDALATDDLRKAARAQKDLRKVQLEQPSAACRLHILEDCRSATALLRVGGDFGQDVEARIKAVRKLGRWLRWRRTAAQGMVPVPIALEGLLWALRSEPEVAWTAQCALYHAARIPEVQLSRQSGREEEGSITSLLLNEPSPFCFCLPQLTARAADAFERALRSTVVANFFSQVKSVTLVDPGYGDWPDSVEVGAFSSLCHILGRSFKSLESLKLQGFEDCAMTMVLPHLVLPKLRSLRLIGASSTPEARRAILGLLRRVGPDLEELELNVWSEYIDESDDTLASLEPMPKVKKLTLRAPPLAVPWGRLARLFPSLEELSFFSEDEYALSGAEVLEELRDEQISDVDTDEEQDGAADEQHGERADFSDMVKAHLLWRHSDLVMFARELHSTGLRVLARSCPRLASLRFTIGEASASCHAACQERRIVLGWSRDLASNFLHFRRMGQLNGAARADLEEASGAVLAEAEAGAPLPLEGGDFDEAAHWAREKELVQAAASAVLLQLVRGFDDPSLEQEFGLRPF